MSKVKSILHIITGLGGGGAEGTLYKLCTEDKTNRHIIISLKNGGRYKPLLLKNRIEVVSMNFKRNKLNINKFKKIFELFDYYKPDIIQGWMYHGNFVSSIVSFFKNHKNLYWNIRNSSLEKKKFHFNPTFFILKLCALISHKLPKKIICCSKNSIKYHSSKGYKRSKFIYIPNGVNTEIFKSDELSKNKIRNELSISNDTFVFGMVARYHKQKDHKNLLMALYLLKKFNKKFKFLLIGRNLDKNNKEINNLIYKYELNNNIILLGEREDINTLICSIDCHVLSSAFGEAFPNVIAEAMACEIPCIATNVGDSKNIIGQTGWIVNPKDPHELCKSMNNIMNFDKKEINKIRKSARERIKIEFSLNRMISSYQKLYRG
tara:strand:- start:1112 stop:2242 length:1131 start_codon:yes stop_codon:yes gene_type:complete